MVDKKVIIEKSFGRGKFNNSFEGITAKKLLPFVDSDIILKDEPLFTDMRRGKKNFNIYFYCSPGCCQHSEISPAPKNVWGIPVNSKYTMGLSNLGIKIFDEKGWPIAELVDFHNLYIRIKVEDEKVFEKILQATADVLKSGKKIENPELLKLLSQTTIFSCEKNCQNLESFGNDLCTRRTLEDRDTIRIHYVNRTPPPAPPKQFLFNVPEKAIEFLKERELSFEGRSFQVVDEKGNFITDVILANEEIAVVKNFQKIDNNSNFVCPNRRNWAKKSDVMNTILIPVENGNIIIDWEGNPVCVLTKNGEKLPVPENFHIPIPGEVGSENINYFKTECRTRSCGKQYYARLWETISPEITPEILSLMGYHESHSKHYK